MYRRTDTSLTGQENTDFYNVILFGGGRQSIAMTMLALQNAFAYKPDIAIFADTGNEPMKVYDQIGYWATYFKEKYDFPVHILEGQDLTKDILDFNEGKIKRASLIPLRTKPKGGLIFRQCTQDYKILPIRRLAKKYMKAAGKKKLRLWLGIAYEEMERQKFSNVKYIENYYPLIDSQHTTDDLIEYLCDSGFKIPHKSSCIICPYHSRLYWLNMKKNEPLEFAFAVEFDNQIRNFKGVRGECFLHRDLIPLSEIKEPEEPEEVPDLLEECDGFCTT